MSKVRIELDGTDAALLGAIVTDKIEHISKCLSTSAELAYLVGEKVSPEEETLILVRSRYQVMAEKIGAALVASDQRVGLLQ